MFGDYLFHAFGCLKKGGYTKVTDSLDSLNRGYGAGDGFSKGNYLILAGLICKVKLKTY
jgi:hypothetical protein